MARRSSRWLPLELLWLLAMVVVVLLVVFRGALLRKLMPVPVEPPPVVQSPIVEPQPTATALEVKPQRFPVAGAAGFFVIVNLDGSSSLEDPAGTVTKLSDAGKLTPETELVRKLLTNITETPETKTIGQLIVLETGVVDVPKEALITYVGKDNLVVLAADGSSKVYHVDGRIEQRARTSVPRLTPSGTKEVVK